MSRANRSRFFKALHKPDENSGNSRNGTKRSEIWIDRPPIEQSPREGRRSKRYNSCANALSRIALGNNRNEGLNAQGQYKRDKYKISKVNGRHDRNIERTRHKSSNDMPSSRIKTGAYIGAKRLGTGLEIRTNRED